MTDVTDKETGNSAGRLTLGTLDVAPGEAGFGSITCAWLPDSSPVEIPLIGVNGAQPGPRLWINSTMHGPEMVGAEVIRQFLREEIDPSRLRGSVVGVPILNPLAYRSGLETNPLDGLNLNRVFPGDAALLASHRIARRIYEAVLTCDYVIDLHANPAPAMMFTLIPEGSAGIQQRSRQLAEAFGLTQINFVHSNEMHRTGTLSDSVMRDGKPALVVELTSWRRIDPAAVAVGVQGLQNVCSRLSMIDAEERYDALGGVTVLDGQLTRIELISERGGIVTTRKELGEPVEAGEVVAIVRDPYGEIVEELVSPVAGWLLAYPMTLNQSCFTGEGVVFIAVPKDVS